MLLWLLTRLRCRRFVSLMVFSAPIFLFAFLPVALAIYFSTPTRARNPVLLVLSGLFYVWGGGTFLVLMIASAIVDYLIARSVFHRVRGGRNARVLVGLSVVINVSLLFWFKYAAFAANSLNRMLDTVGAPRVSIPDVVLPLAISFFTFQRMSFTFDVAAGKIRRYPSFVNYLLFGLLFPHLIAGPIVRYLDIEEELVERDETMSGFAEGGVRFIHGLAKKVLISDAIAPVADAVFANPAGPPNTATAWLGAIAYTFQLYFDFSGYSDMAIGLGKMFGFDFPENFDRPYSAVSITDFWRRWHITLSSWFRDYLFIPLGGSRGTRWATIRNLAIVFLVTGLWHGAATVFVVWGAYHGALVIIERLSGLGVTDPHARWWPLRRAVTLVLVVVGWVMFRSLSITEALRHIRMMLVPRRGGLPLDVAVAFDHRVWLAMAIATASVFLPGSFDMGRWAMTSTTQAASRWRLALFAVVFPATLVVVAVGDFSPFLYFQF